MKRLTAKVRILSKSKLTIIDVMATVTIRRVQPLSKRMHPLWRYNGTNNKARYKWKGPANQEAIAAIIADLFKGEEEEFVRMRTRDGYSRIIPLNG